MKVNQVARQQEEMMVMLRTISPADASEAVEDFIPQPAASRAELVAIKEQHMHSAIRWYHWYVRLVLRRWGCA